MAKFSLYFLLEIVVIFLTFYSVNVRGDSISCTFDSDLCGWQGVGSGKFKWKRGSGLTDDRSSGPLNDHTCANYQGSYMFTSGGDAENPKDIAVMESKVFKLENKTSFSFWYMMNGYGTGSLSLSAIVGKTTSEIWTKDGRQGKDWTKETVLLKPGTMKLQFKSTVRIPVGSDLAIDDVQLLSESKANDIKNTHCQTTTSTSTTPMTTTTVHVYSTPSSSNPSSSSSSCVKFSGHTEVEVLPGTCDFEKDICGIKITANDSDKKVTWERTNKIDGLKDRNDSIFGDHTNAKNITSGFYLVFKNNWGFRNNKLVASLETPAIYATYACVTFWYNIPNKFSNLKVSIRDYTGRLTTVWDVDNYIPGKRASNMTGWHKKTLSLFEDPPFTVVFQTNNNWHGASVGIDDIKIIGANVTTGRTKPPSDGTTQMNQTPNSPGIGDTKTSMFPTQTLNFKTSASTVKKTTMRSELSSTEKEGKKTTIHPTKKPTKIDYGEVGDKDKQTEKDKYEKTATIVGSVVGGVFALVLLAVIVYFIIQHKDNGNRRTRVDKRITVNRKHTNGGVSNGGFRSETNMNGSAIHGKLDYTGQTGNKTFTTFSLTQVNTFNPEGMKQGNGHVHMNGHASPVSELVSELSVRL